MLTLFLQASLIILILFTLLWLLSVRLEYVSIVDVFWGGGRLRGGKYVLCIDVGRFDYPKNTHARSCYYLGREVVYLPYLEK